MTLFDFINEEDPESPGCGTYWCPECGDGKPESTEAGG